MTVKNIASIALGVQIIIGVNTGPSTPLYNTDILNNDNTIFLFGGCAYFKTRKIQLVNNLNQLVLIFF